MSILIISPLPNIIRYLVNKDIVHSACHEPVVIVVVLHLCKELLQLGLLGQVRQLGIEPLYDRRWNVGAFLHLVQLQFMQYILK